MSAHSKSSLRIAAATAIAVTLAAVPLASLAVGALSQTGYHGYRVEFVDAGVHVRSAGAAVGRFELQTGKDGVINGFYKPNDGVRNISITGSREGNAINLRTDFAGDVNLNGTLERGKIVGSGFVNEREVDFVATPDDGPPLPAAAIPVR